MTKAQEINKWLYNQAVCIPIDSEDAKCHKDLGDGRKSYKDNGYMVFKKGEQWYFIPEADSKGSNRTLTIEKMWALEDIFGRGNVKQVRDLETPIEE